MDEDRMKVLTRLTQAANNFPELRLGQLLHNVLVLGPTELFYVSDRMLAERLRDYSCLHGPQQWPRQELNQKGD